MPRYRLLSNNELKHFEKEFIGFLVVNGIQPDLWQRMKEENSNEVEKIVELFSEVIFENIARKTRYLAYINSSQLFVFNFEKDKGCLLIVETDSPPMPTCRSENEILQYIQNHEENLLITFQEKDYIESREEEVFRMMQSCMLINSNVYDTLFKIYNARSGT
ncbi:MAG: hypothetical protein HKN67_04730 [Saprospiraceae bacterium]|nr:hypothetical protein [Saprospiraceae bacterium]